MSLGAKITGLDLGPVIMGCQIFLSVKWNKPMISANLCSPYIHHVPKYLRNANEFHVAEDSFSCSFSCVVVARLSLPASLEVLSLLGQVWGTWGGVIIIITAPKELTRGVPTSIPHLFVWEVYVLKRKIRQCVDRHLRTSRSCQTIIKQLSPFHFYLPFISTREQRPQWFQRFYRAYVFKHRTQRSKFNSTENDVSAKAVHETHHLTGYH